jgi:hypothetical protein
MITNSKEWIQTYTGRKVFPLAPTPDAFCWADIAHALSNVCRFTGHVRQFYSVAEHCVGVSRRAQTIGRRQSKLWGLYCARWGLIHDASEAYISDVSRPVKHQEAMRPYREAEARLQQMIAAWAGLGVVEPPEVKQADDELLATEAHYLMRPLHPDWFMGAKRIPGLKISAQPPAGAETSFTLRAKELGLWLTTAK